MRKTCLWLMLMLIWPAWAGSAGKPAPPLGLVGHWDFDEGQGAVARDKVGWIGDLKAYGNPKWVKNASGYCMHFDGVPGGIPVYLHWENRHRFRQIMGNGMMMCEQGGSYSFWAKPQDGGILYNDELAGVFFTLVMIKPSGWQALFLDPNVIISGPPANDEWTHIAVTWNDSYGRFYVNGELIRPEGGEALINPQINHNPKFFFNIGTVYPQYQRHAYKGYLDDLRYYSRPLTEDEVRQQYAAGRGRYEISE